LAITQRNSFNNYSDCYNIFDNNWYNFNDSNVRDKSTINESSSSAYILFYIRKDEKNKLNTFFN